MICNPQNYPVTMELYVPSLALSPSPSNFQPPYVKNIVSNKVWMTDTRETHCFRSQRRSHSFIASCSQLEFWYCAWDERTLALRTSCSACDSQHSRSRQLVQVSEFSQGEGMLWHLHFHCLLALLCQNFLIPVTRQKWVQSVKLWVKDILVIITLWSALGRGSVLDFQGYGSEEWILIVQEISPGFDGVRTHGGHYNQRVMQWASC